MSSYGNPLSIPIYAMNWIRESANSMCEMQQVVIMCAYKCNNCLDFKEDNLRVEESIISSMTNAADAAYNSFHCAEYI